MSAPGVYKTALKNGTSSYRAGITLHNKHISLGSYASEEEATRVYEEARQVYCSTPDIHDYEESNYSLPFSKFVSIINLRDHGIYFKTPIYLGQRFFSYYIDESTVLTFDLDDLFFYSTHTIMQRGGHLFVADYGMQVNILSRYGIREHAVCGRDYVFANGNPLDFRYGNIILRNRYYGVTRITKKGKEYYKAKIHLHGDFVIGTYETEIEAAIAYNKAADIARKNGCPKTFQENYPEGITNREYATIYQQLPISKRIKEKKFE